MRGVGSRVPKSAPHPFVFSRRVHEIHPISRLGSRPKLREPIAEALRPFVKLMKAAPHRESRSNIASPPESQILFGPVLGKRRGC